MATKDELTPEQNKFGSDINFKTYEKEYLRLIGREDKIKASITDIKEKIIALMQKYKIEKFKDDYFTFTYIPSKAGMRFNGTLLKKAEPETYNKYQVETVIPEILRISVAKINKK